MFGKGTTRIWNWKKNPDHPDDSFVEIGRNTEEIVEKLGRRATTEILVENYQQTCEILQGVK